MLVINNEVSDGFPQPIAQTYLEFMQTYLDADLPEQMKFSRLKDCYETVSRYISLTLLAIYLSSEAKNEIDSRELVRKLVKPSTGTWPEIISYLLPVLYSTKHPLVDQLYMTFFEYREKKISKPHQKKTNLEILKNFASIRNDYWGHNLTQSPLAYKNLVEEWGIKLDQILHEVNFLAEWQLVYTYDSLFGEWWMGPNQPSQPMQITKEVIIDLQQVGRFLLIRDKKVVNLTPFFIKLECKECRANRLCLYDSQHKYHKNLKEIMLIEHPGLHRFPSSSPVTELEDAFGNDLFEQEYRPIYDRLIEVEGRILNQTSFLEQHQSVMGRSFIDDKIVEFFESYPRGVFILTGQPGIGKSAYLSRIINKNPSYLYYLFTKEGISGTVGSGIRNLYYQLLRLLKIDDKKPPVDDRETLEKFHSLLRQYDQSSLIHSLRNLVIVIDAFDEAQPALSGIEPIDFIPHKLPDNVYFLITSRNKAVIKRVSKSNNPFKHFHIDPLSEENLRDAESYIKFRLGKVSPNKEIERRLAASSEGNFLYLKLMIDSIISSTKSDRLIAEIEESISKPFTGLDDLYSSFWSQIVKNHTIRDTGLKILGILAISNAPLTVEDIAAVLQVRYFEVELAIEHLKPVLEIIGGTSNIESPSYRLFHSTFNEYIENRLREDISYFHSLFVKHYESGLGSNWMQNYFSRYLTIHLLGSEKRNEIGNRASFEKLRRILTYEKAALIKESEGSYYSFDRDLDKAISFSRECEVFSIPELIEFSLIKSVIYGERKELPLDYYGAKAMIDGFDKTEKLIDLIGNIEQRALGFATLASVCADLSRAEKFAQKAINLSIQTGDSWEQISVLSQVGNIIIQRLSHSAMEAFKRAFEILENATELDHGNIGSHIVDQAIDEFTSAFKREPNALVSLLPEVVEITGKVGGYLKLMNLVILLNKTNNKTALEILEKAYLELKYEEIRVENSKWNKEGNVQELSIKKAKFIESALLLGKTEILEQDIMSMEVNFDIHQFMKAVKQIEGRDFLGAITTCNHSSIRMEALKGLLDASQVEEFFRLFKPFDLSIISDFCSSQDLI